MGDEQRNHRNPLGRFWTVLRHDWRLTPIQMRQHLKDGCRRCEQIHLNTPGILDDVLDKDPVPPDLDATRFDHHAMQ